MAGASTAAGPSARRWKKQKHAKAFTRQASKYLRYKMTETEHCHYKMKSYSTTSQDHQKMRQKQRNSSASPSSARSAAAFSALSTVFPHMKLKSLGMGPPLDLTQKRSKPSFFSKDSNKEKIKDQNANLEYSLLLNSFESSNSLCPYKMSENEHCHYKMKSYFITSQDHQKMPQKQRNSLASPSSARSAAAFLALAGVPGFLALSAFFPHQLSAFEAQISSNGSPPWSYPKTLKTKLF